MFFQHTILPPMTSHLTCQDLQACVEFSPQRWYPYIQPSSPRILAIGSNKKKTIDPKYLWFNPNSCDDIRHDRGKNFLAFYIWKKTWNTFNNLWSKTSNSIAGGEAVEVEVWAAFLKELTSSGKISPGPEGLGIKVSIWGKDGGILNGKTLAPQRIPSVTFLKNATAGINLGMLLMQKMGVFSFRVLRTSTLMPTRE